MSNLDALLADLTSGDETRAEGAVPGLVELGEDAFPALRDLLSSTDADQRWWALRTLAQSPQARTEWLLPLLNDSVPEVRQAAALGFCSHPDETAISSLVRALSDADSLVSSLACNALVEIGKPAVPFLLEMPKDTPQMARINAIRALAEIADHSAIPALMAALEDDSIMIQHWAEEGLERLGLDMVYLKPE
ncbi:MAG: HEAT repeat domain-containing protein [Anaerolineales bacterium]|nr:HEAT repeat domain-containing protein [Anaerolineales bacterium]